MILIYNPMCDGWRFSVHTAGSSWVHLGPGILLDLWIQAMEEIQDGQLSEGQLLPSRRALLAGAGVTCAAMLAGCTTHDANNGGFTPATSGSRPVRPLLAAARVPAANALVATSQIPDGGGKIIDRPHRDHAAAVGVVQGVHRDLHARGLLRQQRLARDHQLSLPRQQVQHQGRLGRPGPATRPLAPIAIKVEGTSIFPA